MANFRARGYRACTIEEIAEKAGVFKGSFYNHFTSKEALAVESVRAYVSLAVGLVSLEGPSSPLARLREHFEILSAIAGKARYEEGCLLANFSAETTDETPDLRAALVEGVEQWCRAIAEVIRQAQITGELGKQMKADALARMLANAWEGASIRSKAMRSRQPLDEFLKFYFEELLAWIPK